MNDARSIAGDETHDPLPDHVPASDVFPVRDACRVATVSGLPLFFGEKSEAPAASLNARSVTDCHGVGAWRVYAAVSWADDYAVAVLARGPVAAIEQPELADAPVGALLLTDADATRGVVVAERVDGGGWLIRNPDGDGGRKC